MNNKNWLLLLVSIIALVLLIVSVRLHSKQSDLEGQIEHWKGIAQSEKEIPSINKKAEKFIQAIHNGKPSSFFIKKLKDQYKKALENTGKLESADIKNDQEIKILSISTEKLSANEAHSVVLYKVMYKSPLDNEEHGTIDQHVLFLSTDINWIKEKEETTYKVNSYQLYQIHDNMDDYLNSQLSKKEPNK
ncbi:hypothetical protein [Bacillus sp. 1P06AnD]|uniref:hypothetical protein n=1 Tax=Bacillus sp. 1P06AnD TaxID=3132208 RepID=UPI0039A2C8F7